MAKKFNKSIEEYINKPTMVKGVESKKSTNSIATYRNTFRNILDITAVPEDDFVAGKFDDAAFVTKIKETNLSDSTRLKLAKTAFSFLKYVNINKEAITSYVDDLAGGERLNRGEIRSDEEHELHYVDTSGKLEVVENAVREYLNSKLVDERRRLTLLAAYLMLLVPLRPSEAVSIGKMKDVFENYIDGGVLYITKQKSMKVGAREIKLPQLFLELAYVDCESQLLFPSLRGGRDGTAMSRQDYTEQLIKPATLEFFDKEVSSRALRTSVISNKAPEMTPGEQVKFAKQCGHSHTTQIDHYAVFQGDSVPHNPLTGEVAPEKRKVSIKVKKTPREGVMGEHPPPAKELVKGKALPSEVESPPMHSYLDGEYVLQNIPYAIFRQIAGMVTQDQIMEVSFQNLKECCLKLRNVSFQLAIQIGDLFVSPTTP